VAYLPRVDNPNQRNDECTEEKHDSFLLDNSPLIIIVVSEFQSFHQNSHKGGCEEHTDSVFEGER